MSFRTIAIMQPYLFPYIGYFQLMNAVDAFVVYDNIQYTKKGWINRNRILAGGKDIYLSVPLKKGPHDLTIIDRSLSDTWPDKRTHLLRAISECYKAAPYVQDVYPMIERCLLFEDLNLFGFLAHSLTVVKEHLNITTPFIVSSSINMDHDLKGEDKVIEICKSLNAARYVNPVGGENLYTRDHFEKAGIRIQFIKTGNIQYDQFDNEFVPLLSIIDVMMFNDKDRIRKYLTREFTLE